MEGAVLQTRGFTQAKSHLSELIDEVVRQHRPVLIDRYRGKERALVADVDDVVDVLAQVVRFEPLVSVSDGEFVIRLPELNLIAGGEDYEEALGELVELVEAYAEDFFARQAFYRHTDRWKHIPWLLRFALTPASERRELFADAPADERFSVPQPA